MLEKTVFYISLIIFNIAYVQKVLIHADFQAQSLLHDGARIASRVSRHLSLFLSQSSNNLLNLGPSLCNKIGRKNIDDFVRMVLCISDAVKHPM